MGTHGLVTCTCCKRSRVPCSLFRSNLRLARTCTAPSSKGTVISKEPFLSKVPSTMRRVLLCQRLSRHINEKYPSLAKKMSYVQTGYFMSSYQLYGLPILARYYVSGSGTPGSETNRHGQILSTRSLKCTW